MKIFKILYIAIIIVFIISLVKIKELPGKSEISPDLFKQPIQSNTKKVDFSFPYRGKEYEVKPIADYELWGLVVSKNNINAWYNYYHDKNSVNLKDLCVVWDSNINNEVYRDKNINFKSGEWTCYASWTGALAKTFYHNNLSNNHLLTSNPNIQKIIRSVNVGDQIHLKGNLVDYAEVGQSQYRMTSISRNDSNQDSRSGGACEIVYVDEIDILKKNQIFWHFVNSLSKISFAILILIQFSLFISGYQKFFKKINNQ